jgi:hypothetical protein
MERALKNYIGTCFDPEFGEKVIFGEVCYSVILIADCRKMVSIAWKVTFICVTILSLIN